MPYPYVGRREQSNGEVDMDTGRILTAAVIMSATAAVALAGQDIVRIDDIMTDRIESAGFELNKGGEFIIEALGLSDRRSDDLIAYGWLLDGRTREPVWVMDRGNTDRAGRHGLCKAEKEIHLDPGKYELYYYAAGRWSGRIIFNDRNILEFLGDILNGDFEDKDVDEYIDDFYISIQSRDEGFRDYRLFRPDGEIPGALIQFNRVGDSEYLQKGFSLDKDMEIRIYALCEYPSGYDAPVDDAWIIDSETREKVWKMDRWNTDPAGGGRKNRYSNEKIKLDKGNYILYYVTDDSHSYDEFNVLPPYDPYNWGVAILAVKDSDRNAFHTFTPEGRGDALISLTRVGDDEFESQAFQLEKDQSLRIFAVGEYSEWSRDFVDYGWIENASTGKIVWEMTYRNTEHAGGASKNRQFEGLIDLPKGYYIANYITDDSHSYRDWNASAPYEPEAWGLSIFPGTDFDKSKFKLLDESQIKTGADILVKMTRLRDNERRRGDFVLKKRTKIRIYAIGEGDRDEMYDYGWISDDKTGRSVWEMTWRNTEPAGGAKKNRLFDDTVILEPGAYEVTFVTDGSHSFNDWNAAKPRDPAGWGITVSKVEEF
jgi:hypothetical protein